MGARKIQGGVVIMINIEQGRYWDLPWSLVSGCTPCSPGCDHCWSAAMTHRFGGRVISNNQYSPLLTLNSGEFNGKIECHSDRLPTPLKRRTPTIYAIWNDLYHEDVPIDFKNASYAVMTGCERHTYLVLTKRPDEMLKFVTEMRIEEIYKPKAIWHGLTVCNQQEADEKIPIFLQVPGKKFLSIEPMLGRIDLADYLPFEGYVMDSYHCEWMPVKRKGVNAIILGGETGPGARPMHPAWVRSICNQCEAAGVPFFFKQWGEWIVTDAVPGGDLGGDMRNGTVRIVKSAGENDGHFRKGDALMLRIGRKLAGRLLDGRTHDDLPWVAK